MILKRMMNLISVGCFRGTVLVALLLASAAVQAVDVTTSWSHRRTHYGWTAPPADYGEGGVLVTYLSDVPVDLIEGEGVVRVTDTYYRRLFQWDETDTLQAIFLDRSTGDLDTVRTLPGPVYPLEPDDHAYPVIQLNSEPANLWDPAHGLYVWGLQEPNWDQRGEDWERDAQLSLWNESGQLQYWRPVGLRINGGWTRCLPQKSLRLYFDHDGTPESIVHDFFGDGLTESRRLLLRQTMWAEFLLKDHWATSLYRDLGGLTSRWTPAVVYLNDDYWGMYGLRERLDEEWAETTLGLDGQDYGLVKDGETEHGNPDAWPDFLEWVASWPDPAEHEFYSEISRRLDLQAYTDWLLVNAIAASGENGSYHNLVILRTPDGRWRHVMWDEDNIILWGNLQADLLRFYAAANETEYNTHRPPANYFPPYGEARPYCELFRQLMGNAQYRALLAQRVESLLSGVMTPAAMTARMDSVVAVFADGLDWHGDRFSPTDLIDLDGEVASYKSFLTLRHGIFQDQFVSFLADSREPVELSLFAAEATADGAVLNWRVEQETVAVDWSIQRTPSPSGTWATVATAADHPELAGSGGAGVPVMYAFVDETLPAGEIHYYRLLHETADHQEVIHPWVEAALSRDPMAVRLNEFMADNGTTITDEHGDFDDWVEIVNTGSLPVDLAGLGLSDDPADPYPWRLCTGAHLGAGARVIVWCDDEPEQGPLHASFKLSALGESVVLTDRQEAFTAELDRRDFGPQLTDVSEGRLPDGTGSWQTLAEPTPGEANRYPSSAPELAAVLELAPPYPNPANPAVQLRYSVSSLGPVRLEVVDLAGRRICTLVDEVKPAGRYDVVWEGRDQQGRAAATGIYFVTLAADGQRLSRRLTLVR